MEDTAVNLAHRHANEAEDFEERGLWTDAMNMHFKAANQFLLATNDTQSQEVVQTLKLMSANHARQGKDLQRKIAKVEAAAAGGAGGAGANSSNGAGTGGSPSSSGRRRAGSGQQQQHSHQQGGTGIAGQHNLVNALYHATLDLVNNDARSKGGGGGDSGSEDSNSSSSSEISNTASSTMIEESFTLIKSRERDESDPFYKFWEAVENLVVKISSPVAFTSIPLEGDDPALSNSPSTDDPMAVNPVDAPFAVQGGNASLANSGVKASSSPLSSSSSASAGNPSQPRQSRTRSALDPSPMHESFFIIDSPSVANSQMKGHPRSRSETTSKTLPSNSKRMETPPKSSSKTLEEYAIENQQLKMTLDKLSRRNMKLEKNLEGVMQMSVWTKDVHQSAMQLMKSHDILRPNIMQSIMDLSAAGPMTLQRAQSTTGTSQYSGSTASSQIISGANINDPTMMQARLRELEEEVIRLKLENTKLGSSMKKYKQRWEDLKESAKKRRNATSTPPTERASDNMQYSSSTSVAGINPYSASSLAGNPYSNFNNNMYGSGNNQASPIRPVSSLERSSSASGPVLSAGSSYQRRILMESRPTGGLDATPLGMQHHRHSTAGIVSSTSPRVLDSSARTRLNTASEISRTLSTRSGETMSASGSSSTASLS